MGDETPPILTRDDIDIFRKSIGLTAVVDTGDAYEVDTDVDPVDGDTALASISTELSKVRYARDTFDAQYRAWRGVSIEAALAGDPKLAEWKCKARLEGDPQFLTFKNGLAEHDAVIVALEGFADSIRNR